ncbi:hypothetical protein GUJ93_ZPchr0012g19934 [Zizania palustris]|uniref:Uncharacterized protein n=1 Tax=Zizania palustris TaxID=103762 RepID=A0A8J5WTN2_ZIZPA|nr:hypothetical protein GUJ93_ZPchr0012g19934 [Zizania palustris]
MQAFVDLQQADANLRAYLGLAPVASTLPSFPTASSPPSPEAEDEAQGGGEKGGDAVSQTLAKFSLPLPRAASTPMTRPAMRKSMQPQRRPTAWAPSPHRRASGGPPRASFFPALHRSSSQVGR